MSPNINPSRAPVAISTTCSATATVTWAPVTITMLTPRGELPSTISYTLADGTMYNLNPGPLRANNQHNIPPRSTTSNNVSAVLSTSHRAPSSSGSAPSAPTHGDSTTIRPTANASASNFALSASSSMTQITPNAAIPNTVNSSGLIELNPYVRHSWTNEELDFVCVLKIHTALSYREVSEKLRTVLGGTTIIGDQIRYRLNVLSCNLPPTQSLKRKKNQLKVDPRWSYWLSQSPRSLPVQRILRRASIPKIWPSQLQDDYLVVLMLYGDILYGQVAIKMTQCFGGVWTAKKVEDRIEELEALGDGSWAWFEDKDDEDKEVRSILGRCGL